jgi:ketosteroid isomerase-like protein
LEHCHFDLLLLAVNILGLGFGGTVKRLLGVLFITSFFMTICSVASLASDSDKAAIEQVLHMQQDAWNHHDLDAFMTGYWKSPELTFFSGGKENHGWQDAMDHYKAAYDSPGHEMGKLDFSDLRVEMLGSDAAFVRGAFHLTMSDGKTPHGIFTLVFRKFPDGWKIIHDHTTTAAQ